MSSSGNCYDNAVVESFFGLLKRERVNRLRYHTREEARTDLFEYIKPEFPGWLANIAVASDQIDLGLARAPRYRSG